MIHQMNHPSPRALMPDQGHVASTTSVYRRTSRIPVLSGLMAIDPPTARVAAVEVEVIPKEDLSFRLGLVLVPFVHRSPSGRPCSHRLSRVLPGAPKVRRVCGL